MRRELLITCLALAACQPSQTPSRASAYAPSSPVKPSAAKGSEQETPLPVQMFEAHCYRPGANYKTIVAAAEAMKLKPVPKRLEPLIAPQEGSGRSFVVIIEKEDTKVVSAILLGVSDRNICSVYASGYDAKKVLASAKETYKLFSVMRDDIGLQINEMFVPGGTSKRISETHTNGVVGVMMAKPNSGNGDAITLSYVSPGAAKQIFQ